MVITDLWSILAWSQRGTYIRNPVYSVWPESRILVSGSLVKIVSVNSAVFPSINVPQRDRYLARTAVWALNSLTQDEGVAARARRGPTE